MNLTASIVHVVDDDDSYRIALQRLLKGAGYQTRAYASAGEFLMTQRERARGCVVLDLHMPGPNGLELQEALSIRGEKLPIIFISGYATVPVSVCAMKAGAVDFLTKPVDDETLLRTVAQAIDGHAQRGAHDRELGEARERFDRLSPREREVMQLVVAGLLNKQIADRMEISIKTVKVHRSRVMEKMEVRSVAALVHLCELAGITPPVEAQRR